MTYKFEVIKKNGCYIAKCSIEDSMNGNGFVTQGKNREEIFMMVADAFMTAEDVKLSRWNTFLHKLMIYK